MSDLRAETGAGMMDCKKALVEAQGNFEEAKKILRKKGLAAAASKAGRAASEGLVVAHVTVKGAVLLEVNCETDFVARTEDFRTFAEKLADRIAAHDAFGDTRSGDVGGARQAVLARRRDRRGRRHPADRDAQGEHPGPPLRAARRRARASSSRATSTATAASASLVGVPGGDEALGKDLAMHIAASDPRFAVARRGLGPRSWRPSARSHGPRRRRPASRPNVVERIADGKVEKFYQEAVLVEQPFVKDPEKTVGQVIVERAGKGALDLRFVRFKLGEGLGRAEEAA